MKKIVQKEKCDNPSAKVYLVRLRIAIEKAEKAEKKANKAIKKADKMAKRLALLKAEMEAVLGGSDLEKMDQKLSQYLSKKAKLARKKSKIKHAIGQRLK